MWTTFLGGASGRRPTMLELREESLMSEATLVESESRSSHDCALLEGRELRLCLRPAAVWNRKERSQIMLLPDNSDG